MTDTFDRRYLHIVGAVAVGGWFPSIGPKKVNVPIPTVASLHLPIVGGVAEAAGSNIQVDCSGVDFGDVSPAKRAELEGRVLMTLGNGRSRLYTIPRQSKEDPARSFTYCEIDDLVMEGLVVKQGILNLQMVHPPNEPYPLVTFGNTQILGFSLGGDEIQVTIDTSPFNEYPTMAKLDEAYRLGKLPPFVANSLTRSQQQKAGVPFPSNYTVGTIVRSIEGKLPSGASIDPDGYTIDWPAFGKIHLGEITMNNALRRVSLLRFHRCDGEGGSGCSGGGYYP